MKKHRKQAILISFLHKKERYKKLAEYVIQMIRNDPSSPKESLHTIIFRIKDESRLIEKIIGLNKDLVNKAQSITDENYPERIGDLLGIRIICLRLSDVEKVETYLELLSEENILSFVNGPDRKKSFILPVDPGDSAPDDIVLGYSGYSSIHYQVELGENSDAPPELKALKFELQLRTILEEAWSEIDHKYRYKGSRIGENLPVHIHTGFYNLSAYLQVAALQAEYLCRLAEDHSHTKIHKFNGEPKNSNSGMTHSITIEKNGNSEKISTSEIVMFLEEIFGVDVTHRTLIYIEKRLGELDTGETRYKALRKLFKEKRIKEFETIYQEIVGANPFFNAKDQNIDVINALNYAIFHEIQGKRVAKEGLKVVLKWRKNR